MRTVMSLVTYERSPSELQRLSNDQFQAVNNESINVLNSFLIIIICLEICIININLYAMIFLYNVFKSQRH